MSVITEDGSFYTFNVKYAAEPLLLNVEMCDFIHDGEKVNRPNNAQENVTVGTDNGSEPTNEARAEASSLDYALQGGGRQRALYHGTSISSFLFCF